MQEIQAKIEAMRAAQAKTKADHEALLQGSRQELLAELNDARAAYVDENDPADTMNDRTAEIRQVWANIVANRSAGIIESIDAAAAAYQQAVTVKRAELSARVGEIQWSITSIYDYDIQHELLEALAFAAA